MKKIIYILLSISLVFSTIGLANLVKADNSTVREMPPIYYNSPVINGVGGPSTLKISETGTWTINARDPENGPLTYSVMWGDEFSISNDKHLPVADSQQTTTFTHSYSHPGNYTVVFTVTNDHGFSAKTSISVRVEGGITPSITIRVLNPNGGEKWEIGKTYDINWMVATIAQNPNIVADDVVYIYIHSFNENGSMSDVKFIGSAHTYDGKFSWTIPMEYSSFIDKKRVKISVVNSSAAGINDISDNYFSLISPIPDNGSPIINSVNGPDKLTVGQTGTWTINARDPENGPLTYSVMWGDEIMYKENAGSNSSANYSQQTATFTHSYNHPGTYTITFKVTDNQGLSTKTSIKVMVNSGPVPPVINSQIEEVISILDKLSSNASQSVKDKISQIIALLKAIATEL